MVALFKQWINKYPIVSIEDGHDESDWTGFKSMTTELGGRIQETVNYNCVNAHP